jgi:small subunit ribosomal protein S17
MAKQMRKVRVGSVVRTKMDKTAVVETVWKQRHVLYSKQMRRVARFYVHDPERQCQIGDTVRIEETRPISKTKHWRLLEVLQHRQVAEISPIELETEITPVMTGEALAEAPPQAEDDEAGGDNGGLDEDTEE